MSEREILSLAYGRFVAVEWTGYCPGHPTLPAVRSPDLARLVAPGARHAYDLLVRVGIAHYRECRQYTEIRADLATRFHLDIPVRTIGHLAREFVAYVQAVHHLSTAPLRRDMVRRGGYILHVDGTCEEGSRVLLVCMDSISGQVLDSRKIASEGTKEVAAVLGEVRKEWSAPLAVVHDLRSSLMAAVTEVFPGVPQFVCHFHLAADVGKDILGGAVERLRRLFRRSRTRPKLGVIARSLRPFAVEGGGGEHVVGHLIDRLAPQEDVPEGLALGVIHGLSSWILAFSRAGQGYGFPFELPYLELYDRIVAVHGALDGLTGTRPAKEDQVAGEIHRLHRTLAPVVDGEYADEFARVVAEIRRDQEVFEAFRARLRICPREGKRRRNDEGAPAAVDPERHRIILANFKLGLESRAESKSGVARACRIVVEHLDKYWSYLFGHRLGGPHGIVVPRTNNLEEQEFRKVKRGCRRLHGRGRLKRDVDEMPAGTMLLQNLKNPDYLRTVYGGTGENDIANRFSEVDPALPAQVMLSWHLDRSTTRLPRKLERMGDLPGRLVVTLRAASRARSKGA
jgi:hypothetical protein